LAQIPGREREAHQRLLQLWNMGESERVPTLKTLLSQIEEKLNVPLDQRTYTPPPVRNP
jgi:hypothetical protein